MTNLHNARCDKPGRKSPVFKLRPGVFILLQIVLSFSSIQSIPQPLPDSSAFPMFGSERGRLLVPDIPDGYGVTFRDLSGDGRPDLYVVCFRTLNRLLINGGPGLPFSDRTIASRLGGDLMPHGIRNLELGATAVDVDNDNDADLVLTGWTGITRLFRNAGNCAFSDRTADMNLSTPMDANACAAVDADGDGWVDLFLTDEHGSNRLLLNRGDGTFRDATGASGLASDGNSQAAAFSDVDCDGRPDLYVCNWFKPDRLYRNLGNGRFRSMDLPLEVCRKSWNSNGVSFADVDNDGDFDLFVTRRDGDAWLYRNHTAVGDSNWMFEDVTGRSGLAGIRAAYGSVFADFDQDGGLDLYVAVMGSDACFLNGGDGAFRKVFEEPIPRIGGAGGYSTGAACADMDDDGDLDLFVANKDTFGILYVNPSDGRNFIKIGLRGVKSNRDAIGARIELYAAGGFSNRDSLIGVREIQGGSGYLSMSDPAVLFGTRAGRNLDMKVVFPSGRAVVKKNLSPGRTYRVEECAPVERTLLLSARMVRRLVHSPSFWIRLLLILLFFGFTGFFIQLGLKRYRWNPAAASGFAGGFSVIVLAGMIFLNRLGLTGRFLLIDAVTLVLLSLLIGHFERLLRLRRLRRAYRGILIDLGGRLLRVREDAALYETALDTIVTHSEYDACCVWVKSPSKARFGKTVCRGVKVSPEDVNGLPELDLWLGELRERASLKRTRSGRWARYFELAAADLIVPIKNEGRLFGALTLGSAAGRLRVTGDDAALFQSLTDRMAVAIENNAAMRRSNTMIRKLTEAKVREKYLVRLEKANRGLEEKNRELKRLFEELKNAETQLVQSEKMASLGQLVAGISHELNNPIAFIYSNVRQLKSFTGALGRSLSRMSSARTDRIRKLLPDIEGLIEDTERGSRMVKDLVDNLRRFSHLDGAAWAPVDVSEEIASVLMILRSELKDRVQVHLDFGTKSRVECNPGQMNQVYMNLIANAAQAIEGSGNVWISTREKNGRIRISVRDDGKGMTASVQEKIFEPFFTTKEVGKGVGLGLSIVYAVAAGHGGSIAVQSEPGKGSTFTVDLPLQGSRKR
jgi:signal transduction histidine kinase